MIQNLHTLHNHLKGGASISASWQEVVDPVIGPGLNSISGPGNEENFTFIFKELLFYLEGWKFLPLSKS
jgi:hypothetical protein